MDGEPDFLISPFFSTALQVNHVNFLISMTWKLSPDRENAANYLFYHQHLLRKSFATPVFMVNLLNFNNLIIFIYPAESSKWLYYHQHLLRKSSVGQILRRRFQLQPWLFPPTRACPEMIGEPASFPSIQARSQAHGRLQGRHPLPCNRRSCSGNPDTYHLALATPCGLYYPLTTKH